MKELLLVTILVLRWDLTFSTKPVGSIGNVSLILRTNQSRVMNSSREECICTMLIDPDYFALNYFSNNQTCQLFLTSDRGRPFSIKPDIHSRFYFLTLPSFSIPGEIIWDFNGTMDDRTGTFDGISSGNIAFSAVSITGDRKSIDLISSSARGISYSTQNIQLANRSWTFEGWIYPTNISGVYDQGIIGHFGANSLRRCLHLNVRNKTLYFGLFADDFSGSEVLQNSRWYHFAFVINCDTGQRLIYLDGRTDATISSTFCYEGISENLSFGTVFLNNRSRDFDGLIDQISFTNRSKSSIEILDDATLVAYFPFDNNTMTDQGPLRLNSRLSGNITLSAQGRRSSALLINDDSPSYLMIENLVRLGHSTYNYSFTLWINPIQIRQSTLIHVSNVPNGYRGWCFTFIGMNSSGFLLPQLWSLSPSRIIGPKISAGVWTHVALTYSIANGLRLYVNGSLYGSVIGTYSASESPNYVFIGSVNDGTGCETSNIIGGQYVGFVDEFRIYSRELTSAEILGLVN